MDGYGSVSSACLSLLGTGGRGLLSLRPSSTTTSPSSSASSLVFHTSFAVLRLALLWLVTSALLRNYRRARAELYRPVVDLQDYEMVELFLRRLKMWMGLTRTKEFRHKVRFEGMELPPSRSSSTSDCKSLCLPPLDGSESPPSPGSLDGTSEASWRPTSSSPCGLTEAPGMGLSLGLGPGSLGPGALAGGTTWRERAETEATLKRLLPTLDALLQQLDRVTVATEELYRTECVLERAQRKGRGPRGRKGRRGEEERGKSREGRGGKGKGDEKVSAGRRERKGGQQKVNTVVGVVGMGQPKYTGNSGANPKHTPTRISTPAPKSTPVSVPPPISTPAPKSTPVPVPPPISTPAPKPALKSTPVPVPPPISNPAMKSAPGPTPISTPAPKPTPKSTPVSAPIPDSKCTPVSTHIIT
uniref:Uncharacterized protein n=1 Tax=Hucho hucho TaxID=62062 RepID=A0A4W5KWY4_9TELE